MVSKLTSEKALYDVVVHAASVWERTLAAFEHRYKYEGGVKAQAAADRCVRQAAEHQEMISAIIAEASDALEACIDAGRAKEARAWIDALDEMRRVSEAAGVAARLVKVEGAP